MLKNEFFDRLLDCGPGRARVYIETISGAATPVAAVRCAPGIILLSSEHEIELVDALTDEAPGEDA